ncbi:MAG TPA: potassium/proton antiporter [Mycobacteriales bacterium]|nr:potassium/proton antiporter [Mycobacteriales bacterium]
MAQGDVNLALLGGAGVALIAVAGVRMSTRVGVPSLLLYLGIGMLLGEDVLGLRFDDTALAQAIGLIGLALIVAEGGLTTRWSTVRPVVAPGALLATVGVAVSIGLTAVAARLVLDTSWRTAALVAAIVSPTDAAAVFSTLRALRLPRRLVALLEVESGVNDAPVVILVSVLSASGGTWAGVGAQLVYELLAGAAVGVAVGLLGVALLRRAALPAAGLYPVATLALAVASYGAAASAQASGFLAVYVTGLILGNAALPHRRATAGFVEGIGWLAQIGLFVMLGLLATPSRLGSAVLPALAIGSVLLFVARPASVFLATIGFPLAWRDKVFLSAAGLRGAVPIVLTTIPLTKGVAGADRVFDVVFVLVAVFTLVQAPALAPVARRLRLVAPAAAHDLDVEAAPLDQILADLVTVQIPAQSKLHGVEVWELRLPETSALAFVVREGRGFVPDRDTRLLEGDDLLIVTSREERDAVERRLRAVGRTGRLARFLGDDGTDALG